MGRTSTLLLILLAFTPAFGAPPGDPKALTVPPDQLARAKELARQLRSDDVDVRDNASTELAKMGRLALPVLVDTLKATTSNEVETRIELLLPAARKDDFNARYPVFLADKDRKYDHDLPGWNELKRAVGDTPESRLLFSEISGSEECRGNLTTAFGVTPDERKAFESRWMVKYKKWLSPLNSGKDPNWELEWDVAALLADLVYGRDYHDDVRVMAVRGGMQTSEGKKAIEGKGKYSRVVLAFIRHWIGEQKEQHGVYAAIELCSIAKLEPHLRFKCLELSLALPENRRRGYVMDELAKTGDRKSIANLKALFEDEGDRYKGSVLENDGTPRLIQWRDSALAQCLLLTKQKHADYGITVLPTNRGTSPYWSDQYLFTTDKEKTADEKRVAAFKKWAEWEKANPDALKAPAKKDK